MRAIGCIATALMLVWLVRRAHRKRRYSERPHQKGVRLADEDDACGDSNEKRDAEPRVPAEDGEGVDQVDGTSGKIAGQKRDAESLEQQVESVPVSMSPCHWARGQILLEQEMGET